MVGRNKMINNDLKLMMMMQRKFQNKFRFHPKLKDVASALTAEGMELWESSCLLPSTNILTKDGIKSFNEVKVGDKVFALNHMGELILTDIKKKLLFDYDGDILYFNHRNLSFACTPEHKLYVRHDPSREWKYINAIELKQRNHCYQIATKGNWNHKNYQITDLKLKALAWYITEGYPMKHKCKFFNRIKITQLKSLENRLRILNIFKLLGFNPYLTKRGIEIYSKKLGEFFVNMCGKGSLNKHLPNFISLLSKSQNKTLLQELILGDGYESKSSKRYFTSSKDLRDQVIISGLKCGYSVYYRGDYRGKNVNYIISFRSNEKTFSSKNIERKRYKGKVWCLQTETGNFFIDHNGFIILSGNSGKWWSKKPHSKEEKLEEAVDVLHFWLLYCTEAGFSAEEIFDMYCSKLAENYRRQIRGY